MTKVLCFGDSFAAGAKLKKDEYPFVHWVANELNLLYENYGKEGSSLGIILHTVIAQLANINKNDIVLVIIPPDSRWYDEDETRGFYSLSIYMIEDYYHKFLNNKTLEWFEYHHALFIYTIQKLLNDIGCYYIMAHNYGRIGGRHYNLPIDYTRFLNEEDITNLLSTKKHVWDNYPRNILPKEHQFMHDGPSNLFDKNSIYFLGTDGHPNEHGHKKLAEMFLEKYYREQTCK
jgi:hypothetical protein